MSEEQKEKTTLEKKAKPKYTITNEYPPRMSRRKFLMNWSSAAWLTFTGANAIMGLQFLRFLYPNVLFEPPMVFKAGKIEDYDWDKPDEKFKQTFGTWIVKISKDEIGNRKALVALSTVCTHLGCTPNILLNEQKIKCPCHGSGFRFSGKNFEGPAPRPLERYRIYVDPVDGQVVIDKQKKFLYERGEWTDPQSFIDLASV